MNYHQTLQFLFDQLPMYQRIGAKAYKSDLNNIKLLVKHLGHPHKQFKSIHIAGTNGKGSVSNMLASIFMEAGYKTGLHTSPHLNDFRERIRIGKKMVPKIFVINFIADNKQIIRELQPSFFELTVAMAFYYFAEKKVDIAIIETGLGGRLDSTNIITPQLSIITNIALDHTAFLGNTQEKIAYEKAGIIKHGIPVVVGRKQVETTTIFKNAANAKQTKVIYADDLYSVAIKKDNPNQKLISILKNGIKYGEDINMPLLGNHQNENIKTVAASVEILKESGFKLNFDSFKKGLENIISNTSFKGRWQIINKNPLIICDTGHNEDGLKLSMQQLSETPHDKLFIIFGLVDDKDAQALLKHLPMHAQIYFTKANNPRSLNPEKLKKVGDLMGLNSKIYPNVMDALQQAKEKASPKDLIFIGGSTFIVAEVV